MALFLEGLGLLYREVEVTRVLEGVKRIAAWHTAHRRPLDQILNPGLNIAEIRAFERSLGWNLPGEAEEFYQCQNGLMESPENRTDLSYLPGYSIMSLKESASFMAAARSVNPRFWQPRWFPVFSDGGGSFLLLDCSRAKGDSAPVIEVLREELEFSDTYISLGAMLETVAECFEEGAFFIDSEGYLEQDDVRCAAIGRRLNSSLEYWWTYDV